MCSMFVSNFSSLTFYATGTGTVPVCLKLCHVSGLDLSLSVELKIQSRVVFTFQPPQLYRSCLSGRYSIRLHVSTLHISHHQAGHWLTYVGHLESKERLAIKKYLLIIVKKKNMQVLSHTFTYFST